jgi:hypothetical protein
VETTSFDDVETEGTLTPEKLALLDKHSARLAELRPGLRRIDPTELPEDPAVVQAVVDLIERAVVEHLPGASLLVLNSAPRWRPLNWHVTIRGNVVLLSHGLADDDGPVWAGEVELWRGAPAFDDHPELEHAIRSIMNPIHRDEFVRHRWTYDIPDHWAGAPNFGPNHRRYLLLTASGGLINWSLTLRLPVGAPQFVWKAIAYGFKATPKEKS